MRTYEALYIIRPDLPDDDIQTIADGVIKLITDNGGAIVRSETWGKRRLAYEVRKFMEGVYVLVRFQCAPSFVERLKSHFRLAENIILHQLVHFDQRMLRLEAEQERRNQALLATRGARRAEEDEDEEEEERPARGRRRNEEREREEANVD